MPSVPTVHCWAVLPLQFASWMGVPFAVAAPATSRQIRRCSCSYRAPCGCLPPPRGVVDAYVVDDHVLRELGLPSGLPGQLPPTATFRMKKNGWSKTHWLLPVLAVVKVW